MSESPHPRAFVSAPPRQVAFLCVHNAARSQMAEGFARVMAPSDVQVWSAGTEPSRVHPMAIEVMREVGIDISSHHSKHVDELPLGELDTVVSLCGDEGDSCPNIKASARRVRWPLPDPAAVPEAQQGEAFREVREEIRWRVSALWPRSD